MKINYSLVHRSAELPLFVTLVYHVVCPGLELVVLDLVLLAHSQLGRFAREQITLVYHAVCPGAVYPA